MSERLLCGAVKNLSNTCYISCSLQILLRYKPFVRKIGQLANEFPEKEIFKIIDNLAVRFLNDRHVLDPQPLVDRLKCDPTKQQDICEFLASFLNILIDELPKERQEELRSLVNCKLNTQEDSKSDSLIFYTIPVLREVSIKDVLHMTLDDHNEKFTKAPDLFFIQIQRMLYNKRTNEVFKQCAPMPIQTELDLTEFNGSHYHLFCAVQHIGSGIGGHYRAAIQDSEGWVMASDSKVNAITVEECLKTSVSESTPAYLLAYASDMSDVKTLREEREFDGDENVLIPIDLMYDSPENNFSQQPKISRGIECAFKRNTDTEYSVEVLPKIEVITQYFDQSRMEFKEAESTKYNSITEILDLIEIFKSDVTIKMVYGYKAESFSTEMPSDIGHYDTPLYIMFQPVKYRVFLDQAILNPHTTVHYNLNCVCFDLQFFKSQTLQDVEEYGTRWVKIVASGIESYNAYIIIKDYLMRAERTKTIQDYLSVLKCSELNITLFTSTLKPSNYQLPIKCYRNNNPYFDPVEVKIQPKLDMKIKDIVAKTKNASKISDNCGLWAIISDRKVFRLLDPLRADLLYDLSYELKLVGNCTQFTSYIILIKNMRVKASFFMDIPSTFDKLSNSIQKIYKAASNLVITFHPLFQEVMAFSNSPQELVQYCYNNGKQYWFVAEYASKPHY